LTKKKTPKEDWIESKPQRE